MACAVHCTWQVEASSGLRGIGLVKLMGRQSGFIAMQVRISVADVCAVLLAPHAHCAVHVRSLHVACVALHTVHCAVACAGDAVERRGGCVPGAGGAL